MLQSSQIARNVNTARRKSLLSRQGNYFSDRAWAARFSDSQKRERGNSVYPILENNACIWVEVDEDSLEEAYFASNAAGKQIKLTAPVYHELCFADGTHPLQLSERTLQRLVRARIIRTRRFSFGGPDSTFTLFPIGSRAKSMRPFLHLANKLLPPLSVLLFAAGSLLVWDAPSNGTRLFLWPCVGLLVFSLLFHEFGHFAAAVSAGCPVSEAGICLFYVIPFGAYVSYEINLSRITPRQHLQIALAGVEWNLLLCGLFFLSAIFFDTMGLTLFLAGVGNLIIAAVNLLPGDMLDGGHALGALLGVDDLHTAAKRCFADRKGRRRLLRSGPAGVACYAIFVVGYFSRGISFLVLAGNLLLWLWVLIP